MKRALLLSFLLIFALSTVFAESTLSEPVSAEHFDGEDIPLLGGTVEWPEVRGHRFGAAMQQVMLMEESMGSGFAFYDYGGKFESPADLAKNSRFDAHFISTSLTVLDRPAVFDYRFGNNALTSVRIGVPVSDEAAGSKLLRALADEITRLYGPENNVHQGEHSWNIGYGFQHYAVHQEQTSDEGFSGRILLSCTQAEQGYDQWEAGQWWVNLSIGQIYTVNASQYKAEPSYSIR